MEAPPFQQLPRTSKDLLDQALKSGRVHIGQILLGTDFSLRHQEDAGLDHLKRYDEPQQARQIARYDGLGNYRPLKSAPNLGRGWLLHAGSLEGMELALDFFYPSALGLWLSWLRGTLHPTPFRETLARQTGMYRVTQLLTEAQAGELVARCCNSETGCLRTILWKMNPAENSTCPPPSKFSLDTLSSDRIPLICRELCNLVVAAARPIAKGNLPKVGDS